ncbi:MAG: DUF4430 domain-containing protein [Candidatus Colwellbacteria bacterium]|nr:DUF4430 domain-containing protein [Candidatus Colwellbacteria bacterium]
MFRNKKILSVAAIFIVVVIAIAPFYTVHGDVNSAVQYLESKTPNPWVTMALVAAGESPDVNYLKSVSGPNATDYEAPILALVAAGKNPKTFPNTDLIAALKTFHTGGQIGSASTLNDDIFGLLALVAAGEPTNDTALTDAKNFILNNQNTNGGWAFVVGGDSDTNMTAMAIMALLSSGIPKTDSHIVNALNYLKSAQNGDGGFPYDPVSPWGTDSDASSDAWVISAIRSLGDDPDGASWSKNGNSPVDHLVSLQAGGGYFEYQKGTGEDSFSPVTTSYAAIALSGKYYPVSYIASTAVPEVNFKIEGKEKTVCEGDVRTVNPLELVKTVSSTCGFTYLIKDTSFGPYLEQIGNEKAEGTKGWLYAVNFVLPNVGAVDYKLKQGDYVLWHYGDFNWQPSNTTVDLSVDITTDTVNGSQNSQNQSENTVSLNVSIPGPGGNLDLGSVAPGASKAKTVNLVNNGTTALYIESAVTGDSVFRDYLKVNDLSWRSFNTNLSVGENKNEEIKLQIPSSYANSGSYKGSLIFWGTTTQ